MNNLTDEVVEIAAEAGQILLSYYMSESLQINQKSDESPVTEADIAADKYISSKLEKLNLKAPILSEEGDRDAIPEKLNSEFLWVVDPLDGTKSFINETGEFAVSIGLLKNLEPILGVLYLPVLDTTYYGISGVGSFKISGDSPRVKIDCLDADKNALIVNRSLDIPNELLNDFDITKMSAAGKFGIVAEGNAGIYFRNGPTCEWDTAAGQAIVEAAGGRVVDLNGTRLTYGKKDFLNPSFVSFAPNCTDWNNRLKILLKD